MKEYWGMADGKECTPEELPFYASDSEQLYNQNLVDNREELEKNGWKHHKPLPDDRVIGYKYDYNPDDPAINDWVNLSYRINTHGFRGEEMPTASKKRSVICLGDSNTFGVGVPEGKIWSTRLSQTLRVRAYNLGIVNGSLDSAFRVLLYWLPKIKPSHVFMLTPSEGYEHHLATGIVSTPVSPMPTIEDEWILHREKVMRAMQSLCDQFNTPFIHDPCDGGDYFSLFQEHDWSRDLQHYGSNRHIHVTMNLLKKAGYSWEDVENS